MVQGPCAFGEQGFGSFQDFELLGFRERCWGLQGFVVRDLQKDPVVQGQEYGYIKAVEGNEGGIKCSMKDFATG